jgi:hypothetical protein
MPPQVARDEFAEAEAVRVVALMTAVAQGSFAFAPTDRIQRVMLAASWAETVANTPPAITGIM